MFNLNSNLGKTINDIIDDDTSHPFDETMTNLECNQVISRHTDYQLEQQAEESFYEKHYRSVW